MNAHVPQQLMARPQWVCWTGLEDKAPRQPDGKLASSTDPKTWSTYADASAAGNVGFVFTEDDDLFGIDLDKCRDPETGELSEKAQEILNRFPTYAEVSPSGRGVHLIGRGRLVGSGFNTPEIELYDRGRYFTVTGQTIGKSQSIQDCAIELAKLQQELMPEPTIPEASSSERPSTLGPEHVRRIEKYLETIEPAVSGQNGDNKTYATALKLVGGFGLTPDEAYPFLVSWNQRCEPPWTEERLRRNLGRADHNTTGIRGHLWGDGLSRPLSASPLPTAEVVDDEEFEPETVTPFPVECLSYPGLLGECTEFICRNAPREQPELAMAASLSVLSVITGRLVQFHRMRTNLYIVALAPSGCGKDYPREAVQRILLSADWGELLGAEEIGSDSGLARAIAEQPKQLVQYDEFGDFLSVLFNPQSAGNSSIRKIIPLLKKLYTSSGKLWTSGAFAKSKTHKVMCPHLVLFGTSVPQNVWGNLNWDNVTDGLVPRLMLFNGRDDSPLRTGLTTEPVPEEITARVRQWRDFGERLEQMAGFGESDIAREIKGTAAAERAIGAFSQDAERIAVKSRFEGIASIWRRATAHATKLALIAACSRCESPQTIEVNDLDVEFGVTLTKYQTETLIEGARNGDTKVGQNSRVQEVLDFINSFGPEGVRQSRIVRSFRNKRVRESAIAELIESDEIVERVVNTATKKAHIWMGIIHSKSGPIRDEANSDD